MRVRGISWPGCRLAAAPGRLVVAAWSVVCSNFSVSMLVLGTVNSPGVLNAGQLSLAMLLRRIGGVMPRGLLYKVAPPPSGAPPLSVPAPRNGWSLEVCRQAMGAGVRLLVLMLRRYARCQQLVPGALGARSDHWRLSSSVAGYRIDIIVCMGTDRARGQPGI